MNLRSKNHDEIQLPFLIGADSGKNYFQGDYKGYWIQVKRSSSTENWGLIVIAADEDKVCNKLWRDSWKKSLREAIAHALIESGIWKPESKSKNWVYLFKPRFSPMVESGSKCMTIRPERKDGKRPNAGDTVSLREWTGKPYASKQRVLRAGKIERVSFILIDETGNIWISAKVLLPQSANNFALADGFADRNAMIEFFKETHGLPFKGRLIEWEPTP